MKRASVILLILSLLLALPALSAAAAEDIPEQFYVIDLADILTDEQEADLTERAYEISRAYDVSVHIGTLDDMTDYGFSDIEACAESFYNSFALGLGDAHNGILLLLSMADRDYDLDALGEFAHYAFTDYGKTTISDMFLDNFRQNDWYGGFSDYLTRCGTMLSLARDGQPVDITTTEEIRGRITPGGILVSLVLSVILAWIVCTIMESSMKSVRTAAEADEYIPAGASEITLRRDRFTHATTNRVKIESSSRSGGGGGGTTISSGGHSHSSGKF